ncbi:hypothetical protein PUNSTDRAFT_144021 [Punctularia strigosozonata HHB-11173 SS5]|uniref:uncharacterized protein n=1 Tax=Punctularia strigosozonata (strain HHB-11173) TaxID=741275 RepID=UPI00044168A2|nr:uncharacterized protein PUNSTDRAFT_144021 [Punctularia strigosozonata HHB-11173 SS5]EIN08422.1 hypothetical protein PUNSTDRAFT_144021 [Punctularia strigosozonata HHB-11173 SS5]
MYKNSGLKGMDLHQVSSYTRLTTTRRPLNFPDLHFRSAFLTSLDRRTIHSILTMNASSSLNVALSRAILNLTQPLLASYDSATILALTQALHANLTAAYTLSWDPSNPTRGSGRRCLSFSPATLPPRPVHAACVAANVSWAEWSRLLGNREFDMFIDPGRIAVRVAGAPSASDLWTDAHGVEARKAELDMEARRAELKAAMAARVRRIIGDRLAAMEDIPDVSQVQIRSPVVEVDENSVSRPWTQAPIQLPSVPVVPTVTVSRPVTRHSRSSSISSTGTVSSAFSFESDRTADSLGSVTSATTVSSVEIVLEKSTKVIPAKPTALFVPPHKRATFASKAAVAAKVTETKTAAPTSRPSRRERARMAKVTIDKTREATPYDMGRTIVLTGGVMLGAKRA